ncbi:DUF2795 domain-containing protein [Halorarum halophilum]|uniref:DUF2795 domain-containing protein n=1 Tax=Halorarum halophilum TaxID=2743090 RepID=A0A7D5KM07_9EURY|nr:DUF2795 domain-containing protein [Halobaculum halophilum]QLG27895.1 DUF2795 domain-containing protein [Halobaculum halophilum]
MSQPKTDRDEGVDFTDIKPVLEGLSFPITRSELVEQYGARELGRTNVGSITIEELFGPMGEDTFESADDVREMVLSQMPRDSVGRQRYSDRGVSNDTLEGTGESENESF